MPNVNISAKVLTVDECEQIIANLDECIALFEKRPGLNALEIRLKTLLRLVREEVPRRAQSLPDDLRPE